MGGRIAVGAVVPIESARVLCEILGEGFELKMFRRVARLGGRISKVGDGAGKQNVSKRRLEIHRGEPARQLPSAIP